MEPALPCADVHAGRVAPAVLADLDAAMRRLRVSWEFAREAGGIPDGLRPVIAASWRRSEDSRVDHDRRLAHADAEALRGFDHEAGGRRTFRRAAAGVLGHLAREVQGSESVIAVCDADGRILERRGDPAILARTARQNFAEAVLWSEWACGTNAIGTALAVDSPVQVLGAEHYCLGWHAFVCTAAPVRHPLTGQVLGVLDVTGRAALLNGHMFPLVLYAAEETERRIEAELAGRERRLLEEYLRSRSGRRPVFTVDRSGRTIIANAAAMQALSREELLAVLPLVREAIHAEADRDGEVDLSARTVRACVAVVRADGEPAGAMVTIDLLAAATRPPAPKGAALAACFGMAGEAPAFLESLRRARRIADAGVHALVGGEPGTGKSHLARAIAGPDARRSDALAGDWAQAVEDPGAAVLEHVDALPAEAQLRLAALMDRPGAPRVIAVASTSRPALRPELASRLRAGALELPPVRERPGDVERLIAAWAARVGGDRPPAPQVARDAVDELRSRRLAGNVAELFSTLEAAELLRRGGAIRAADLPPDDPQPTGAELLQLQAVEREVIHRALDSVGGSVTDAARLLGVSRATLYRRLRAERLLGRAEAG